jgi:hypothetical protein
MTATDYIPTRAAGAETFLKPTLLSSKKRGDLIILRSTDGIRMDVDAIVLL